MSIVIIGASGSGKGTQGELIEKDLGWKLISMGELGREEMEKGTNLGGKLKTYWNAGKWAPTELVIPLLERKLKEVEGEVILDGVPRIEDQVGGVEEVMRRCGKKIDKVIYLWISDDEAVKRLSARLVCPVDGEMYNLVTMPPKEGETCDKHGVALGRRDDDQPEQIRSRLAEFSRTVTPVLDHFKREGLLVEVNGERSVEEIHEEIMGILK